MRARHAGTLLRGIAALITLVALFAGLPLLLYRLGGSPIPEHFSGHQITSALGHRDNGSLFIAAVRDISWLAWAAFAVAVLAEAQAALRGRQAPNLLGGLQGAAGKLVAVAALTFSSPAAVMLAGVPAMAATTAPVHATPHHLPARSPEEAQMLTTASQRVTMVEPGQCLWTIAKQYLGDGDLYPQIIALNQGHDMGHGQVFSDPSEIQPGWILQLPAQSARLADSVTQSPWTARHDAHPSSSPKFSQSHTAAGHTASAASHTAPAAHHTAPAATKTEPAAAPVGPPAGDTSDTRTAAGSASQQHSEIPDIAIFAAGMLAGGAAVALSRLRHNQRQARQPGRRIALPYAAPVAHAEQMLRVAAEPAPPATALRTALSDLGSALAASGQQLPGIAGIHLTPTGMEMLLTSPASEPPPEPFTIPGGRQGMAWHLALPAPPIARRGSAHRADLMPGLFTAGRTAGGGYVLLDLEHLMVTAVQGPPSLVDRVVATAAAELATSELSGWYDLILCGCRELEVTGGRATTCASLDEALGLLAAKSDAVRRRLGDGGPADIRYRRITEPLDDDWALTLLVSRTQPDAEQMEYLLDLASGPSAGGIAVLVAAGEEGGLQAPARFELAADATEPGGIVGRILPMQLEVRPQTLSHEDYRDLVSLFTAAADLGDVPADAPAYQHSVWLPPPAPAEQEELTDVTEVLEPPMPAPATPSPLRVGVLGPFTVNGAPGSLLPAQSQLLLALALHMRTGLSNSQLCFLLGADPDHAKPTDSLRQLIARTRRQLGRAADGREWITHLGNGQYALHPDARFDWAELDALAERGLHTRDRQDLGDALDLIRGLPFTGADYWWLDPAFAEAARAQIVDAAELLADIEIEEGNPSAAIRAVRTGLAGDESAEQLWRALMRAEHAAGNLTGVREAWNRCLNAIAEVAPGGEPHPDTAALYQQLTRGARPQHAAASA